MTPQPTSTALWLSDQPLVLASGSSTRRDLLTHAGIPVTVSPSTIDERAVETSMPGAEGAAVAAALAAAKALDVASRSPGRLVLGADQTLTLEGRALHKPTDSDAARAQLSELQGRRHHLVSAYALAKDGALVASGDAVAAMTMRPLSNPMIECYLHAAGSSVTTTVGAYQLERLGAHLFDRVEGDTFTVLGLPIIAVLASLRRLGVVAA